MSKELTQALSALKAAVEDEGPMPTYHRRIARKTRRSWPTLMDAVDRVLATPETKTLS